MVDTRFVKDNQTVTRSIAGETIIVPIRSGIGDLNSIYTLNEVGTSLWQLIDGQHSVDQLVELISNEYEVSQEAAAQDVTDFLTTLEAEGLIRHTAESER